MEIATLKNSLRREVFLLILMLFIGILVIPVGIYFVGAEIFGEYAGHGFGDFFSALQADLRSGEPVVLFLVFSPYIVWQVLRLSIRLFLKLKRQ